MGNLRLVANLAMDSRDVFSWLLSGGSVPNLARYIPVAGPKTKASPAVPPHLESDVRYWLDRQTVSLRLVEEMQASLVQKDGPVAPELHRAFESIMFALASSRLTMESVSSSVAIGRGSCA